MREHAVQIISVAVPWLIFCAYVYAQGGVLVPFLLAMDSLRLRVEPKRVVLTGFDATAMLVASFVLSLPPAVLSIWGCGAALAGAGVALVFCLGCRLRVEVTPERTRILRTVAFVLPWSYHSYRERPSTYTDGWGDFLDPLSLYLEVGSGVRKLELGWEGKKSPSCEELSARFNAAIAGLVSIEQGSPAPTTPAGA